MPMTRGEAIDLIEKLRLTAIETALLLDRFRRQVDEINQHNAQEPLNSEGGLSMSLGVLYGMLADMIDPTTCSPN